VQSGSILAVPLWAADKVMGVLVAASDRIAGFRASDRALLETLSSSAAIAIENAHLHREAQRSAAAAERSRLARELHDAVSQTLFSASVIAETLPRVAERDTAQVKLGLAQLQQLTRGALAEMRALLLELRPSALLEAELPELLKQLANGVAGRTRIAVTLQVGGIRRPPPEVHIALYRLAQESLNNVVKHARATTLLVRLRDDPDGVELRIRDDGRGFDPDQVPPDHLGLGIMRERALATGLILSITSQAGQGTEVVVRWPIDSGREEQV
jgi:signal transduction histidine kinase